MQLVLRAREGLGWIKIDHMAFRFTERRGLGNWGFIYLGTPFLIHNQRGGDDGGDGKKGVFPSETELRELCLEGGRVMHVTVTYNLGGRRRRRSPILRPQTEGVCLPPGCGLREINLPFHATSHPNRPPPPRMCPTPWPPRPRPSRCATLASSDIGREGGRGREGTD